MLTALIVPLHDVACGNYPLCSVLCTAYSCALKNSAMA